MAGSQPVFITVRTPTGRHIVHPADPSEHVMCLKARVGAELGFFDPEKFCLLFRERELCDGSVAHAGLTDGSLVDLSLTLRSGRPLSAAHAQQLHMRHLLDRLQTSALPASMIPHLFAFGLVPVFSPGVPMPTDSSSPTTALDFEMLDPPSRPESASDCSAPEVYSPHSETRRTREPPVLLLHAPLGRPVVLVPAPSACLPATPAPTPAPASAPAPAQTLASIATAAADSASTSTASAPEPTCPTHGVPSPRRLMMARRPGGLFESESAFVRITPRAQSNPEPAPTQTDNAPEQAPAPAPRLPTAPAPAPAPAPALPALARVCREGESKFRVRELGAATASSSHPCAGTALPSRARARERATTATKLAVLREQMQLKRLQRERACHVTSMRLPSGAIARAHPEADPAATAPTRVAMHAPAPAAASPAAAADKPKNTASRFGGMRRGFLL